jgi:hypothetical protein
MSVALAAVLAVAALASSAGARAVATTPCRANTDATYLASAFAVATRIAEGEHDGAGVEHAIETVERDTTLATAVADDDPAAVEADVAALVLHAHEHIVRLRVLRDGKLLDDLGGPLVLAPVRGTLQLDGRVVGTFQLSVQDDLGYEGLAQRLVGAAVVIRYQGATIMSNISVGSAVLPANGTLTVSGKPYLVETFGDSRFPDGRLEISILLPVPAASVAAQSCRQVAAEYLAGVARRIYEEYLVAPWYAGRARAALATESGVLAADVAGEDGASAQHTSAELIGDGGLTRLRIVAHGTVIADAGSQIPLIAPLTAPLTDSSGRVVGQAIFSIESAQGYVELTRPIASADVLVRSGAVQLAGTISGPARLPTSGPVTYRGLHYTVASFSAVVFPDQPVRVSVLVRS